MPAHLGYFPVINNYALVSDYVTPTPDDTDNIDECDHVLPFLQLVAKKAYVDDNEVPIDVFVDDLAYTRQEADYDGDELYEFDLFALGKLDSRYANFRFELYDDLEFRKHTIVFKEAPFVTASLIYGEDGCSVGIYIEEGATDENLATLMNLKKRLVEEKRMSKRVTFNAINYCEDD